MSKDGYIFQLAKLAINLLYTKEVKMTIVTTAVCSLRAQTLHYVVLLKYST